MALDDLIPDFGDDTPAVDLDFTEVDVSNVDWVEGEGHMLDPWWQDQEVDGLCAPTSGSIVVSFLTGIPHAKDELVAKAIELGLLELRPDGTYSGMTMYDLEHLLEYYNVDADVQHGSMEQLNDALDRGSQVIVAADSDEVWYAASDDMDAQDMMADHALVVAGIDWSRETVILSDPGNPNGGQGYEMTIEDFKNAWADSGNEMLVTESETGAADQTTPTAPEAVPAREERPPMGPSERPSREGSTVSEALDTVSSVAALVVPLTIAGRAIKRIRFKRRRGASRR